MPFRKLNRRQNAVTAIWPKAVAAMQFGSNLREPFSAFPSESEGLV